MDDYDLGCSMDKLDRSLPVVEDGNHALLEAPRPAYSDLTIRRAFGTWLHCGHKANFRIICDYYHRLEAMEDTLPPEERVQSRHHEIKLLDNHPPKSVYQMKMFPDLYSNSHVQPQHLASVQAMTKEKCIFKLEGFHEIVEKNTASNKETHTTCREIRKYCKTKGLPLRTFLSEFKNYVAKCSLQSDFSALTKYINHKKIQSEIYIIKNCPKTFSFLDEPEKSSSLFSTVKKIERQKTSTLFEEYLNTRNDNVKKLNNSTAKFFESFANKQTKKDTSVSCWIFDADNQVTKENLKSRVAGNFGHTEDPKTADSWSLLKSLICLSETTKIPNYEEYKIQA